MVHLISILEVHPVPFRVAFLRVEEEEVEVIHRLRESELRPGRVVVLTCLTRYHVLLPWLDQVLLA